MDNKRVLIVDDDLELGEQLAEMLRDEGCDVKHTSSCSEGESFIELYAFDLAIFDFKMSECSGMDMLKKIKDKTPQTKVFIMTGRPFIEALFQDAGMSHLVEGFIKKPFSDKTLFEQLARAGCSA